ncbi:DJ-1/PfpI family protein [Nocardia suismassiliense]|uniref:DJ-1/PfpI family protein n=1 Tax=Nocardia suismassiliense TaxID=2077092 RepID=UPI000D1FD52B|nr:DJ-1/PfpI family protein [Nocardia suismassiliense]
MQGPTRTIQIGVLVFEGADELDVVGAFEPVAKAARCAEHQPRLAPPRLFGPTSDVTCSNGLRLGPVEPSSASASCDALVVPGGAGARDAMACEDLTSAVRDTYLRGGPVYSVCSGSFLLAAAGVLDGHHVAVHRAKTAQLRQLCGPGVTVSSAGLVEDGQLTSAGGEGAGVKALAIGFSIIRRFAPSCLECISARMEVRMI